MLAKLAPRRISRRLATAPPHDPRPLRPMHATRPVEVILISVLFPAVRAYLVRVDFVPPAPNFQLLNAGNHFLSLFHEHFTLHFEFAVHLLRFIQHELHRSKFLLSIPNRTFKLIVLIDKSFVNFHPCEEVVTYICHSSVLFDQQNAVFLTIRLILHSQLLQTKRDACQLLLMFFLNEFGDFECAN